MERVKIHNIISIMIITVMVASVFTIPALTDNHVDAAKKTKKVKVTFKANGGKFTAKKYAKKKSYSKKIKKGKKIGKLPKVKRSGYKFKGWYTKKKGGKKVTKKTKIKKKTTLYARWTKKTSGVNKNNTGAASKYPGLFTMEKYKMIEIGMSLAKVKEIVGGSPDYDQTQYYRGNFSSRITKWNVLNSNEQIVLRINVLGNVKSKENPFGW